MKRQWKLSLFGPRKMDRGYLIAFSLMILLFSNFMLSNPSSSMLLSKVFAQSDRRGSNQGDVLDERLSQAPDNAKKLRQVAGERIHNQYIEVLKNRITAATSPPTNGLSSSSSSSTSTSPTTADSV